MKYFLFLSIILLFVAQDISSKATISTDPKSISGNTNGKIPNMKDMKEVLDKEPLDLKEDDGKVTPEDVEEMQKFIEGLSDTERAELENLGREIIKSMDPQELQEFAGALGISSDELLNEANKPLEKAPIEAVKPVEKPVIDVKVSGSSASLKVRDTTAETVVKTLIKHLTSLQSKESEITKANKKIASHSTDIVNLITYLNTIVKKSYYKQLVSEKYLDLFRLLEGLNKIVEKYEPRIVIAAQKKTDTTSPYAILTVSPTATHKEIETAYKNLMAKYSDSEENEDALTMQTIEEAYAEIGDEKTRKQYDREHTAQESYDQKLSGETKTALSEIATEFEKVFSREDILSSIEEFIKAFEVAA
jgi:hypothetical protein